MHRWEMRMRLKYYLDQGVTKAELSRRFGVSERTIYYWIAKGQLDRDLVAGGTRYASRRQAKHKLDPYKRDLRCGVFQEFCAASGPQSQYFPPDFRCNSTLRQVVLPLSAGKSAQEPEPG